MSESQYQTEKSAINFLEEIMSLAVMSDKERVKNSVKACILMPENMLKDLAETPGGVRTLKEVAFESLKALKKLSEWAANRTDEASSGNAGKEPDDHPISVARNLTKDFQTK